MERFYSSIRPALKKWILLRGTIVGAIGALIIVLVGMFVPVDILQYIGLPVFLLGLALVVMGLVPYRRISRLELQPHELILEGDTLHYLMKGKLVWSLPVREIRGVRFRDDGLGSYGIVLDVEGDELYLPYFTERSWKGLSTALTE